MSAAVLLAMPVVALAGNTWDGGGTTNNWSDSVNWSGDTLPAYGTLTFSGSTRTTNIDDYITSMNQINWSGSSNWTLNQGGSTVLSLYDNGGTQAKIENYSTGLVTVNLPVSFSATTGNNWGEINAVNGGLTFGGAVNVFGSGVLGLRLYGGGQTTTFAGSLVTGSTKYVALVGSGTNVDISGSVTTSPANTGAPEFYVMNNGTLTITGTATGSNAFASNVRLGGDFGATGTVNTAQSGTLRFTKSDGGASFSGIINAVTGNTSGSLSVQSLNSSGTNTLAGSIFLDSPLKIAQAVGGTLDIPSGTDFDIKGQALTVDARGTVTIGRPIMNSVGSGSVFITNSTAAAGVAVLSAANTYAGGTTVGTNAILRVANTSGSATGSGAVTVNGTLVGTGKAGGSVGVSSTGKISAGSGATRTATAGAGTGDAIGTLTTGDLSLTGGGTGVVKVNGTAGTAGTNFDLINIVGKLDLGGVSTGSKFNLVLTYAKAAAAFTPTIGQTFRIAYASAGIYNGASAYANNASLTNLFVLNTADVGLNGAGFDVLTAAHSGGGGQDLMLQYTGMPEPGIVILAGLGGLAVVGRRRGRTV